VSTRTITRPSARTRAPGTAASGRASLPEGAVSPCRGPESVEQLRTEVACTTVTAVAKAGFKSPAAAARRAGLSVEAVSRLVDGKALIGSFALGRLLRTCEAPALTVDRAVSMMRMLEVRPERLGLAIWNPPPLHLKPADLQITTRIDLAELLRVVVEKSGLSKVQLAKQVEISRSQLYNLINPNRCALPRYRSQLLAVLRTCSLVEDQIRFILVQWQRLDQARPERAKKAARKPRGPEVVHPAAAKEPGTGYFVGLRFTAETMTGYGELRTAWLDFRTTQLHLAQAMLQSHGIRSWPPPAAAAGSSNLGPDLLPSQTSSQRRAADLDQAGRSRTRRDPAARPRQPVSAFQIAGATCVLSGQGFRAWSVPSKTSAVGHRVTKPSVAPKADAPAHRPQSYSASGVRLLGHRRTRAAYRVLLATTATVALSSVLLQLSDVLSMTDIFGRMLVVTSVLIMASWVLSRAPQRRLVSVVPVNEVPARRPRSYLATPPGESNVPPAASAGTTQTLPQREPQRPFTSALFGAPRPIRPSMRTVVRCIPAVSELSGSALFKPLAELDEAAASMPKSPHTPPQAAGRADLPGPFGVGSAMPRPGGGRPSGEFTVKASVTALRYCIEGSERFPKMVAEVWFRTAADARRVGFLPLS
jgi:hypothetical protein